MYYTKVENNMNLIYSLCIDQAAVLAWFLQCLGWIFMVECFVVYGEGVNLTIVSAWHLVL